MYSRKADLRFHDETLEWELLAPFSVEWRNSIYDIDKGFRSDLASIPRIVRWLIPQVGKHIQPAIVHDWVYAGNTDLTRLEADQMFLDGMKFIGVSWWKRQTIYRAVRMFGGLFWKGKST